MSGKDVATKMKTRVILGEDRILHGSSFDAPTSFASVGVENGLNVEKFTEEVKVEVNDVSEDGNDLVFELSGVDAPLANTLRRILLSEVPTMAIEIAEFRDNTSVIQDEVFAHRLGLVPIKADPAFFETHVSGNEHTPENTLIFDLNVKCFRDINNEVVNSKVFASALVWTPFGEQAERFAENPPQVVHPDILLAKLAPGQRIDVRCYVTKGVGKVHAKWSPVATASYRLLPEPVIVAQPKSEEASRIAQTCPTKVFDIEDSGELVVARPRQCTMCRECIRPPPDAQHSAHGVYTPAVELRRVKTHFIFSVESTGILPPDRLVRDAIGVLKDRALFYAELFDQKDFEEHMAAASHSDGDDDASDDETKPMLE
ncbi:DNA-directed RNA polymerase I and III subunit rpac1 [Thecamonas trahens ATCC 50062]|uniref:DNA-directed RNA polymerase I and III subunit rpac1 n=1 Tax=Thecamonas trahens ATCC 50062 TaxID=461836 RepID=A0A0L0DIG6_THETB|nr:DNA-directed RNA polymerase I and III subunit rpac1 [Thecamonas trahens ATCC 50062]KNC52072.1 DNA-directed RNA polymerase I and III subunit rpac1 [Thecamonas trahens ATCC 50062]|eukprot:XP_013762077.1 DNA-directed RNA polymerase I and III subunit rpac1 [Thecamonas trahens ATCC 50062]